MSGKYGKAGVFRNHYFRNEEVRGSTPLGSTRFF
jgi:hypothetical protein